MKYFDLSEHYLGLNADIILNPSKEGEIFSIKDRHVSELGEAEKGATCRLLTETCDQAVGEVKLSLAR